MYKVWKVLLCVCVRESCKLFQENSIKIVIMLTADIVFLFVFVMTDHMHQFHLAEFPNWRPFFFFFLLEHNGECRLWSTKTEDWMRLRGAFCITSIHSSSIPLRLRVLPVSVLITWGAIRLLQGKNNRKVVNGTKKGRKNQSINLYINQFVEFYQM